MSKKYEKPALSFEQQLDKLVARGLVIRDRSSALQRLACISYYRLSAYWYPFRLRDDNGNITGNLEPDTTFEAIIQLYEFDRELRLSVLDALERIEIAIRTKLTYHLAHAYGPFAHTDAVYFHPGFNHNKWLTRIVDETCRSSDEFIRHYQNKYSGFPTVPIWMLTEVMSLGSLSFLYRGLLHTDKKVIADEFSLHHKQLADWLHTLTYIRNVCAHHSRLWNRELAIRSVQNKNLNWLPPVTPRNDRVFYILLMLKHLLNSSSNGDTWTDACTALLHPIVINDRWRIAMGMPESWEEHPVWSINV